MPLPTTQPFDYPDWGAPGVLTATGVNVAAIAGMGDTIYELAVGYYNHTLLVFDGNADGESYSVNLKWYTANPLEGGSLQIVEFHTVATGSIVSVPITNPTTYLIVEDAGATTYPHNVLLTVTQFAAKGTFVGYPGGTTVGSFTGVLDGAEVLVRSMDGCAPGRHSVALVTDAASWDLALRVWYDWQTTFDIPLADETTVSPWAIEWIAPASSWQLVVTNNDGSTKNFSFTVNRLPG